MLIRFIGGCISSMLFYSYTIPAAMLYNAGYVQAGNFAIVDGIVYEQKTETNYEIADFINSISSSVTIPETITVSGNSVNVVGFKSSAFDSEVTAKITEITYMTALIEYAIVVINLGAEPSSEYTDMKISPDSSDSIFSFISSALSGSESL